MSSCWQAFRGNDSALYRTISNGRLLAGTTSSQRRWVADVGRGGARFESQLAGSAWYSHSRREAELRKRLLTAWVRMPRDLGFVGAALR